MNAEDIARFLREHPDFLTEHGEIFALLTVPHPDHGGQAISLAERQLHALRDKIRQLELKLGELIRFGEENDEISDKVHRMAVSLLEAHGYDGVRHALFASLLEDFNVPHVSLRIWNSVLARDGEDFSPVGEGVRLFAGNLQRPYCGAPGNIEVLGWFGEAAPHVRSVALMPLRRQAQVVGMLALGSEEAERFYIDMGTLYLERIGALACAALLGQIG
ncbi:hypothetical protein AGMMS49960_02100 [Betaproteobacteria bacterium]|nr:hypothetical protein AGMMS49543_15530 [Betaproteobacteria bacterium]GHT98638.1 hypothetical protein AGMMS49960_02100 [Betaproteobacteria bacterium]GHU07767.1 hypothetical protein AGMMS50225_05220 [Betaproteobacteria bacterium]